MMRAFVTGTDTGVGKTVVCAWLVRHWNADYWKPVQSGTAEGRDGQEIIRLAGLDPQRWHPSQYELKAPLSPHEAARLEGCCIELSAFSLPRTNWSLVVEGAGGVLVPINDQDLMVDLMVDLGLPAIVVARTALGTINHTLLTLEALRRRGVAVAGVVLNGPPNAANRRAIAGHGKAPIIGELPPLSPLNAEAIRRLPPPSELAL
jgi:dethiobiotin synthase